MAARTSWPWSVADAVRIVISDEVVKASTPLPVCLDCCPPVLSQPGARYQGVQWEEAGTHPVGVDVLVDVVAHLGADEADVAAEVVRRQAKLDKLLLLHEDVVGHVVDDLGAKDAAASVG